MDSIFDPLLAEGLTSLSVHGDWKSGECCALARREWEPELDFARYRRDFDRTDRLAPDGAALGAEETADLYRRHDRLERLQALFALMRKGRHQMVEAWVHAGRNIRFLSNVHSSALGLDNGRHAIRGGGIRRHGLEDPEEEVLIDGLNLARGMSFKNAAARIPYGGCKACVHSDPIALDDLEALGFLAWCIDRARVFTGPDMGLSPEHADVLRRHFTRNIVGGPGGALGPTGVPTARGVFLALIEAARDHLGRDGLAGLSVAVQGLGAVGHPLASDLLAAGVERLVVADPDPKRRDAFLQPLAPADLTRIEVVSPEEILFVPADIVSPNALGGILGPEEIGRLGCRIVMGAANNQLRAVSQEEERELAERLAARGILYQVDWMHNGAGVMAGAEEYERQEEALAANVTARLERVCRDGVRENLAQAREQGLTPTALAYRRIEAQIYGEARGPA